MDVMSSRQYKKKKPFLKSSDQKEVDGYFNPISFSLLIFAIITISFITIRHITASFIPFAIVLISLGISALLGSIYVCDGYLPFKSEIPFFKDSIEILLFFIGILSLIAIVGITSYIFLEVIKFALSDLELYFYYGCAGVIEEAFFRHFLISFGYKIKKPYLMIIVSLIVFTLAHIVTYWEQLEMLLILLFGAIFFTIYFILYKDITVIMIAHIIINIISVGNLLVQA